MQRQEKMRPRKMQRDLSRKLLKIINHSRNQIPRQQTRRVPNLITPN